MVPPRAALLIVTTIAAVSLTPPALARETTGWRCSAPPIEPCAKQHGRLSGQNGIARKIWLIGTTRVVGLSDTEMPALVERYIDMTSPDYSYIYGDFTICPLEPDRPGHLRFVCVTDAEKLVVQNLRRARPPFRLLATWR